MQKKEIQQQKQQQQQKRTTKEKIVPFIEWPIAQKMLNYTHTLSLYIHLKAEHLEYRKEKMNEEKKREIAICL